jgi:hypothetical protein
MGWRPGLCWNRFPLLKKEARVSPFEQLMSAPFIQGRVVIADALQSSRPFCQAVRGWKGDSIVIIKDHVPAVRADLEVVFFA